MQNSIFKFGQDARWTRAGDSNFLGFAFEKWEPPVLMVEPSLIPSYLLTPQINVQIVMRRVEDGAEVQFDDKLNTYDNGSPCVFWWEGGNASCDCNRADWFDGHFMGDEYDPDALRPCGEGKYLVRITHEGKVIYDEISGDDKAGQL